MAQESVRAAHEVSEQADRLSALADFFKVQDEPAGQRGGRRTAA